MIAIAVSKRTFTELAKKLNQSGPFTLGDVVIRLRENAGHGSLTFYTHHACRCDACRAANTAYHRRRKQAGKVVRRGGCMRYRVKTDGAALAAVDTAGSSDVARQDRG